MGEKLRHRPRMHAVRQESQPKGTASELSDTIFAASPRITLSPDQADLLLDS